MDKSDLIQALGFDPDILETPEMDLYRFGFYRDDPPDGLKDAIAILEREE